MLRLESKYRVRLKPKGFTLIEILISIMLLAVGLSSIMAVFIVGLRDSRSVVNESSAAIYAKSILAEILYKDDIPAGAPDGVVDTIGKIYNDALLQQQDWIWLHVDSTVTGATGNGGMDADAVIATYTNADLAPIAINASSFSYRCRASRYRGTPGNPLVDLVIDGATSELRVGRTPRGIQEDERYGLYDPDTKSQLLNPDSDEIWRLTIELFDAYAAGDRPIATFDTYICLGHR